MASSVLVSRVTAELGMLVKSPPPGVSCWPVGDSMIEFEAVIIGAEDTPYEKGEFKISISLPPKYPIDPPRCLFMTKVYHPNIDESGRICLDILKPPPKGSWKPSLNLSTVLISLRLLLSNPNPEDPIVAHISEQYINDFPSYLKTAQEFTTKYAIPNTVSSVPPPQNEGEAQSNPQRPSSAEVSVPTLSPPNNPPPPSKEPTRNSPLQTPLGLGRPLSTSFQRSVGAPSLTPLTGPVPGSSSSTPVVSNAPTRDAPSASAVPDKKREAPSQPPPPKKITAAALLVLLDEDDDDDDDDDLYMFDRNSNLDLSSKKPKLNG